ncbi:MAG TPA: N-acetylmuramoyl-L-alanine amidase [Thermoanaerobaculia bacterium]|nr:N-acetylmuramoyl-L-alanine amidase [Thermoanaerobaculia bacterium]
MPSTVSAVIARSLPALYSNFGGTRRLTPCWHRGTWQPVNGGLGPYTAGPFRIVHHTTEGTTYEGALEAYRQGRGDLHFTVDGAQIYQHIDTSETARSLRHPAGQLETNRHSAVQIEIVGFAGSPKDPAALTSVARLCRWIEATHEVPQRWPNGPPRFSTNNQDPGGHNRDPLTWDTQGGHYGHSQVPGNTHWDPGYVAAEVVVVTPQEP